MDLENFATPEVGLAVAITGVLSNSWVRTFLRRAAVLGVTGGLAASEGIKAWASGFKGSPSMRGGLQDVQPAAEGRPLQDEEGRAAGPEGVSGGRKGHSVVRKSQEGAAP